MLNVHLYELAKVREQEFLAEAAKHPHHRRDGGSSRLSGVAKRLRRRHTTCLD